MFSGSVSFRHKVWYVLGALLIALPASAQEFIGGQSYNWCGYALLEGIVSIEETDLTLISYLTPPESDTINPYQMFQTRWNLAGNAVIVEGCFIQQPERGLIVQLLDASAPGLSDVQIDAQLVYTLFESVEATRAYLSANQAAWEE